MRDRRFIAEHRGGPLTIENHRLLAIWAADCAEHVLHLFTEHSDDSRAAGAIVTIREWAIGNTFIGNARDASIACHNAARTFANLSTAATNAARSAGHAVATAHMADHCLRASRYAILAATESGMNATDELGWQADQLPQVIRSLVLSALDRRHAAKAGSPTSTGDAK